VLGQAKDYNIQIDNLCQFLPQDRVVEFATLSATDRLKETQRAAAPARMTRFHESLKKHGKELKDGDQELQSDKSQLESLEARQRTLQHDVDRLREREQILKDIELKEKAKPFVIYNNRRMELKRVKDELKVAKEEFDKLDKEVQPSIERPERKKQYRDALKDIFTSREAYLKTLDREAKNQVNIVIAKLEEQRKDAENNIDAERKAERTRRQELENLKKKYERNKKTLENDQPPDTDLSEFNNEIVRNHTKEGPHANIK
jgi:chromosome segregation ATPase